MRQQFKLYRVGLLHDNRRNTGYMIKIKNYVIFDLLFNAIWFLTARAIAKCEAFHLKGEKSEHIITAYNF